jgi:lysyl endopeptidase
MLKLLRLAAAAALFGAAGAMAQLPVVPGEPSATPKATAPAARLRLAPGPGREIARLAPITENDLQGIRNANQKSAYGPRPAQKRLAVGIVRPVAGPAAQPAGSALRWSPVAGGVAAQAAVTSPDADAMRLAIDLAGVPLDVEMVFFGSDAAGRLVGPIRVGDVKDRTLPWWSPVTDGQTQTVEFFVPARHDARTINPRITQASHIFTTIASAFKKRAVDIGDAGSCNVDIKCSSLSGSQAFLNVRNAVAQMVFNEGSNTFLCSGTMLNDTAAATQIPWFYTANHCFENETLPVKSASQMQSVANTLNTLWFFEAEVCHAQTVPPYLQLTGGAQFIYNNPPGDVLFLRLNDPVPAGSFLAGWDPNPIPIGVNAVTIHHPQGDLKKVTQGTVLGYSNPPVLANNGTPFTEMRWNSGTTEGGSSGAGLFTFDGSQYLLRGGLWGGTALCSNPGGTDNYSRFDAAYPALANYLSPSSSGGPDYTDLWWNPNESGWGLNLIQNASRTIFAVWYTYGSDNKMTWFHVSSGTWTSANTYSGTLYATTGSAANQFFDQNRVTRNPVGTGTLTFSDANNGTWTFTVNGISGSKAITRLPF